MRHYKPDLVILDGVRDLVADINDGVVAQNCIERLMHLASEVRCCIVCILHQNKSAEDRNLRGWIGTELKNKAFEVYECSKSSERIFMWGQTDTRKYDIIDTLKFAVNDEGIPYLCSEEQLKEALYQAQRKVGAESNIAKDHIYRENVQKAIEQGIILQSKSALNGKNIYMLRTAEVKASSPIRTSLYEREGSIWAD